MTDTNESPRQPRIFKIGTTRIVEDDSLNGLDGEGVRALLKGRYPEITHATIREVTLESGQVLIEFLPQPGRKG